MKLNRLYSEPQFFTPIQFNSGLNLILGESTESDNKTNGVGKSLAIEFIKFGLLSSFGNSRVSKVPSKVLPSGATVILEFTINNHLIASRRRIDSPNNPTLEVDGKILHYSKLEDATKYLGTLLFQKYIGSNPPTFRSLMGPLMRDERSEFKSIVNCYNTDEKIPPDYTPHLWMLNINPKPYITAMTLKKDINKTSAARSKAKKSVTSITGRNIAESKSELNELSRQVERIQKDIGALECVNGYELIKDEILNIELQLDSKRSELSVKKLMLSKIELFDGDNYIDTQEVAELFGQFNDRLAEVIKTDLEQVIRFKKEIDEFQRNILETRSIKLEKDIAEIEKAIRELSTKYRNKVRLLDHTGMLKSLKNVIAIGQSKNEELSVLASYINAYNKYDSEYKLQKHERNNSVYMLDSNVKSEYSVKKSFEKTLLEIHQYVFGNKRCSFDIDIEPDAEVVKFVLRTDFDGSYSINRERVFLYDIALLTNELTSRRHPGILIHDNIFSVDQDTLVKSINYIADEREQIHDKQYILTLNKDKFRAKDLENLHIDLDEYAVATFTRREKFMNIQYQEK